MSLLKLPAAATAAVFITSAACADLTVNSASGASHIDGYVVETGFDRVDFDLTDPISTVGDEGSLVYSAASGRSAANATSNGLVSLVPLGFKAQSSTHADAHIGAGSSANAVSRGQTDLTVLFSLTTTDPLQLTGSFSGGYSMPGGRSFFGDASLQLFNPLGVSILRLNALATGSTVSEVITPSMLGEYRLVFVSNASAIDYGGGGFSGGSITGFLDVTVRSVPAPGSALLALAGLPILRRRR